MRRVNVVWGGTVAFVKGIIRDQNDIGLQPTTLKYSLYVRDTRLAINNKKDINLTPVSNYVDGNGIIQPAFTIAAADNLIAGTTGTEDEEIHVVRVEWTWPNGSGADEISFTVRKLPTIT